MNPRSSSISFLVLALLFSPSPSTQAAEDTIDFNRDIRPIFASHCLLCHGPDEEERMAGLRLDVQENYLAERESGSIAVVPGDPDASELIARITSDDDDLRMPPADVGQRLTREQIDLLTRWVRQGAEYSQHWSYIVPVRGEIPSIPEEFATWAASPIDHFVLDRMRHQGLRPAEQADRYALVRRVFLDLTGLPPTVEEADAFVSSDDPNAWENLVDDLLQREAFGEHWARKWLDLARYADSAGYADDPPRTIWAWRDWVIRSFNDNMPFDQFTIEQMAGDLLPDATDSQRIATAFHRNTLTNSEGGTIDEEFRNVAIVDRVNTTMAVWMGTTMGCAQCHSHKYDPITQEEYFKVFAILNNTEDSDRRDETPVLEIYPDELRGRQKELDEQIARLESVLKTPTPELAASQTAWEEDVKTPLPWMAGKPSNVTRASGNGADIGDNGTVRVTRAVEQDTYTIDIPLNPDSVDKIAAIRLDAIPDIAFPNGGSGHGSGNFVITGIKARLLPTEQEIPFTSASADYHQPDFEPADVLRGSSGPSDGWAIGGQLTTPHQLVLVPADPPAISEPAILRVIIEQNSPHANHLLAQFRLSVTNEDATARRSLLPSHIATILNQPPADRSADDTSTLAAYYRNQIAPELDAQRKELAASKFERTKMMPMTTVPVLSELTENRRETRLQYRGNWLATGEKVEAGIPAAFHQASDDEPADRLALAGWLVAESNPLTARVLVNRYWETLFGRGLVLTSEDFGTQGESPTHPELLDWLATEMIRISWDCKAMLKQIVMSSTYRQDARVTADSVAADPDNRWLARGPRIRLSAEMVRDQALFVSGLLSPKLYGPPVRPPQPNLGLNAAFGSSVDWTTSEGEDRYRRGLYTTWRRSNPYPSMVTFDAPNREVCTIRRNSTNTPLQSLVTLNDPAYVEAAQALARLALRQPGSTDDRITFAFRRCLIRPPTDAERAALIALYDDSRRQLADDTIEAARLATEPLGALPEGIAIEDAAAMTVVGNVLLNLDEMFLKR